MRLVLLTLTTLFLIPLHADPKSHYMIHCMGCHLMNGQGVPPEVPGFNKEFALLAQTGAGRSYLVRVPGASQSPISDAELAELLNWMLDKYAPGQDITPYTASEITRHRTKILADPKAERTRLLAGNTH